MRFLAGGESGCCGNNMNKAEQREAEKRRHEYLLMELRLTGEDIKTSVSEKYEKRVSSLERWRSYVNGIGKGIGVAGAALIAWWKYAHHFTDKMVK